jgi:hypothetical protein
VSVDQGVFAIGVILILIGLTIHETLAERRHAQLLDFLNLLATFIGERKLP